MSESEKVNTSKQSTKKDCVKQVKIIRQIPNTSDLDLGDPYYPSAWSMEIIEPSSPSVEKQAANFKATNSEALQEEVNGAELLEEISSTMSRFVVLPEFMDNVLALWVMLTYCYDNFRILPQLAIYSPEKRCGKTTLLEVLGACANNALAASNITPAAVYHVIENDPPTLIIDEADTFFKRSKELQGICNSGHTKSSAYVIRAGKNNDGPIKYSTWCPKVIALIGNLGDTQRDRSIAVDMQRKLTTERVESVPLDIIDTNEELRQKCLRWATDNSTNLRQACPEVPETDNNREHDNWTPLFAIADCVGGEWPDKVKQALISVTEEPEESESISIKLLRDIHKIFAEKKLSKIHSKELVKFLTSIEEAQWGNNNNGKVLNANSLANLLEPYKIKPKQIWTKDKNKQGYHLEQFIDSFNRYIPDQCQEPSI